MFEITFWESRRASEEPKQPSDSINSLLKILSLLNLVFKCFYNQFYMLILEVYF